MRYTYANMPNKTKEGIRTEVSRGLADIAFYALSQLGIPLELFEEMLEMNCPTNAHKLKFYMDMRNKNPQWFR